MKRKRFIFTKFCVQALTLVLLPWPARASQTTWIHDPGTPGDWFVPANWSNGVPNSTTDCGVGNGGTALISSGSAVARILSVGERGAIVQSGDSRMEVRQGFYMLGENSRATYTVNDNASLYWWGYAWMGYVVSNSGGEFTQNGGTVFGARLVMENSTYRLNAGSFGYGYDCIVEMYDNSQFIQNGGFNYAYEIGNEGGVYRLAAGLLQCSLVGVACGSSYANKGMFFQTGGAVVTERLHVFTVGAYDISGGALTAYSFKIGGTSGTGRFEITGASSAVTVTDALELRANAEFSAVAGSVLHFPGTGLINQSTNSSALGGLGNLNLIVERGGTDVTTLEAAGRDLGPEPGGWTDNFVLGSLTLGGSAPGRIRLVNDFANQPGWGGAEALYVENLVLNPGAYADLNGLNLYYRNGGGPKKLLLGDGDLDADVDFADYQVLEQHFGLTTGAVWADGDFDGDRTVTFADYQLLEQNFAQSVPEPGSAILLMLGAAVLFRRRATTRACQ